MSDINDFLNTLGYDFSSATAAPPTSATPIEEPIQTESVKNPSVEESPTEEPQSLTEDDITGILEDNGFYASSEENPQDIDIAQYLSDEDNTEEDTSEEEVQQVDDAEETHSVIVTPSEVQGELPQEESNLEELAELLQEEHREENITIPLNSPTLLIDEATTRFSGTEWFSEIQKARIILAGVGGIGSNVAFQLARMVPSSLTIYDDDTVNMVNMAGQLFRKKDIGKAKVDAIYSMIQNYTTMEQIYAIRQKFTSSTEAGDIMICGFDNMKARHTFFKAWLAHINSVEEEHRSKCLYLDGRLSIDTLQVFCIQGDDEYNIKRYQKEFLFSDSQADETICSMKQTTYLACMIGSIMVNLFTNFIANTLNPIIPYDLPFFTEYDAQNMIFKTEN